MIASGYTVFESWSRRRAHRKRLASRWVGGGAAASLVRFVQISRFRELLHERSCAFRIDAQIAAAHARKRTHVDAAAAVVCRDADYDVILEAEQQRCRDGFDAQVVGRDGDDFPPQRAGGAWSHRHSISCAKCGDCRTSTTSAPTPTTRRASLRSYRCVKVRVTRRRGWGGAGSSNPDKIKRSFVFSTARSESFFVPRYSSYP